MSNEEIIAVESAQENAVTAAPVKFIASFDTTTKEGAKRAYNAAMLADEAIRDHIGETISMTGYLIENIEAVNEFTGEVENRPHIVVFSADGTAYEGQSVGLVQALSRISNLMEISDENPLDVEFAERRMKRGVMYTLKLV